ncbi:cyclin-dependent kinase inhibitor 1C-like [Macrobrachium rosenbergii]|uniref:cyclin-dependent kinase inhibitor 1C-like n=1 Tax=Macrobrachium rosenbergii TaxID=79674 RepID=UPI0034D76304
MTAFAKMPVTVASHLGTQVTAAPASHPAVLLPPGVLAPLSQPGPSSIVTSTMPYLAVPAVADFRTFPTPVPAPDLPGSRPGLAPAPAPPMLAANVAAPGFPGSHAALTAPVASGAVVDVSAAWVAPSSLASLGAPASSAELPTGWGPDRHPEEGDEEEVEEEVS